MSAVQRAHRSRPKSKILRGSGAIRPEAETRALKSFTRVSGRWLRWQCQLLNDVQFAAVVDASNLPDGAGLSARELICQIGSPKSPLIVTGSAQEHQQSTLNKISCWQLPIQFPGRTLCVIFHIGSLTEKEQTAVDRLLRWGALNLTDWLSDAQADPAPSMPPVKLMLAQTQPDKAAAHWVDDLQSKTQAARVSVGWFDNDSTQLLAVSGQLALDSRRTLPRALAGALGECVKTAEPIAYPPASKVSIDLIHHQTVYEHSGEKRLVSVPMMLEEAVCGAVLFELNKDHDIETITNTLLEESALATPILAALGERNTGAGAWFSRYLKHLRQALFNPATTIQKTIAVSSLALLLIALVFPFSHSASVRGEIQGADRQVLAAAHGGYLNSASARAGDSVTSGQVLAKFDLTQLQLERDTWVSELARIDAELVKAMSARDRSAVGKLRAEQLSANAEVELIDHRITQSDIVAPFDGILVSGDLDDRLGSSVEVGESLFQIASLDDYTLQLDVPEQHAAKIQQGSTGDMRFAAFPSQAFSFAVESMVPVAVAENGINVFRMQASLIGDTSKIRPGMTGVAKVTLGSRSWLLRGLDFMTHRFRYWLWSFGA